MMEYLAFTLAVIAVVLALIATSLIFSIRGASRRLLDSLNKWAEPPFKTAARTFDTGFITVLGYREDNCWKALALDFDLAGHGDTPENSLADLLGVIDIRIKEAQEKNDPSMIGSPSEQKYFDLFREAYRGAMLSQVFHCNDHLKEGFFCATLITEDIPSMKVRK
jgi:hypothetical protein